MNQQLTIDQIIEREAAKWPVDGYVAMTEKHLRALLEEAIAPHKKDSEMLDWKIRHEAFIYKGGIGFLCKWYINGWPLSIYGNTPREAIDAAMKEGE